MKLTAQQNFSYTHRGYDQKHYAAGQEIETEDEEMIEVSTQEGWAVPVGQKSTKPAENKAKKSAPENK